MPLQDVLVRELRDAYAARARDARRFWFALAALGVGLGLVATNSLAVAGSILDVFSP